VRRRREVEGQIVSLPAGMRIVHLTLTTGNDGVVIGCSDTRSMFAALRRRTSWTRFVEGGVGQIEIEPAKGQGRRWNAHLHVVLAVHESCPVDVDAIEADWRAIVMARGLPCSFAWQWVAPDKVVVDGKRKGVFSPVGYYTTKKKRSEWARKTTDAELLELVHAIPDRKLAIRPFGRWPRRQKMRHAERVGGLACPDSNAGTKPVDSGVTSPAVAPASPSTTSESREAPRGRLSEPSRPGTLWPRSMRREPSTSKAIRMRPARACTAPTRSGSRRDLEVDLKAIDGKYDREIHDAFSDFLSHCPRL